MRPLEDRPGNASMVRGWEELDMALHNDKEQIRTLQAEWAQDRRWAGIQRDYTAEEVLRLRPSIHMEYSLAQAGARRLWQLMQSEPIELSHLPTGA